MRVRQKEWVNPFRAYFGLGDFLFFLAVTPFFSLRSYVLFFICSMVFSLAIVTVWGGQLKQSVPLAGLAALFFAGVIAASFFFPIEGLAFQLR
ncbi:MULTISPECIES: hypothetical protein [unclassified Flavobacterium]|uniref:hypothetical protein n=1 Tax=unclassified Flavobacterium TaxID=196869 RepID=UPI001F147234|nr:MULTISPECIES: hypothetical protein [unclassified Flavobacterium]UMY66259.1 hypothetical protein MKO97_02445 [Flavobacterium sp. HJ-32-4]